MYGKSVRGGGGDLTPNDKSHEKQDLVSTMQNTGWTNYSHFLVWYGLEKVLITIGQSTTIFPMAKVMKNFVKPSNTTTTLGGQLTRLSCDVSKETSEKIVKKY